MGRRKGRPWPPRFAPAPAGRDPRTLQDIEGDDWGEPTFDSYLVETCHALRHKPLGTLSIEDLRVLIGQEISLPILVPLALDRLEENPLAEGDFYEGDLLASLVSVPDAFWEEHVEARRRARDVAQRALALLEERGERHRVEALRELGDRVRHFLATPGSASTRSR